MTGYRRAYGRSRMPRRYVPWSEKVFYLEQSKRKAQVEAKWHGGGIFTRIKDEFEIAVAGTPHGAVFARSIRRVPKEDSGDGMLFNNIKGVPWELQLRVERNREQSAVGCPSCNPRERSSTSDKRRAAAKKSLHQAISGIVEVRVHGQVYRVPACEIGIEAGGPQRGVPCHDCQAHDR